MRSALVHCDDCERAWFSQTLAEGLRAVGKCPRCSGELTFAPEAGAELRREPLAAAVAEAAATPPHLVLGLPRR